jgi:fluoride ion exporter CrcB/FEX
MTKLKPMYPSFIINKQNDTFRIGLTSNLVGRMKLTLLTAIKTPITHLMSTRTKKSILTHLMLVFFYTTSSFSTDLLKFCAKYLRDPTYCNLLLL